MVPEETQEATDHLPRAHAKSSITQPHVPEMVTSTNGHNEGVCDTVMPQAPDEEDNRRSNDANTILDRGMFQELTFPFPEDPSSTLDIQGSSNSDQGTQSTCFSPSSSELLTSRAASSEPPNISNGGSAAETTTPNNPQTPFPFFTDPYEYEMEKLRREKESVKKKFEEKTLELMAELERKMAEARSEFDKKLREADAEYKARAMEDEAKKRFLEMSNLLASAYMYKTSDTSDLAALRAKISSIQQQQPLHMNATATAPPGPSVTVTEAAPTLVSQRAQVQTNTHMDPASPPPGVSATATEAAPFPNLSGGLSQQAQVETTTHMDATSPPPGVSATATEAAAPSPNLSGSLSHFPRANRTQRRNTHTPVTSTALSPPLPPTVTAAEASVPNPPPGRTRSRGATSQPRLTTSQQALSLHSPLSNTPRPGPPPVISNLTPSSPSPLGLGFVRGPAPHVKPFRASPAMKTYQRTRLAQKQQQQGNSNGGLVYLSDDDE